MNVCRPAAISSSCHPLVPLIRSAKQFLLGGAPFLLAAGLLLVPTKAPGQPAGSGVITGQVSNAATHAWPHSLAVST